MNFVTEDEVTICSENSEDESNDPHRTVTSPKIIGPEITTQAVTISTTQERKEFDINVTKAQLQNLQNKLVGKILALKSYFIDEILSLNDQIKTYKINDNAHELSTKKSEDLIYREKELNILNQRRSF